MRKLLPLLLLFVSLGAGAATFDCTVKCTILSNAFTAPIPDSCRLYNAGTLVASGALVGNACSFPQTIPEGTVVSFTARAVKGAQESVDSSPQLIFTSSAAAVPFTMGETNVLPTADSNNGNLLLAQGPYTLAASATLQSLSFYVTAATGNLRLGVYDNASGKPGTKKAETASFAPVVGWNTATVTPTILAAGTYWLAYLPSANGLAFRKDDTAGVSSFLYAFTFGTMPATFSAAAQPAASHWSMYATLTPLVPINAPVNLRAAP